MVLFLYFLCIFEKNTIESIYTNFAKTSNIFLKKWKHWTKVDKHGIQPTLSFFLKNDRIDRHFLSRSLSLLSYEHESCFSCADLKIQKGSVSIFSSPDGAKLSFVFFDIIGHWRFWIATKKYILDSIHSSSTLYSQNLLSTAKQTSSTKFMEVHSFFFYLLKSNKV